MAAFCASVSGRSSTPASLSFFWRRSIASSYALFGASSGIRIVVYSARSWVGGAEPERDRLADACEVLASLGRALREPRRQVVAVQHVASRLGAEQAGQLRQRDD